MSLALNLAGRQGCNSERQRTGATRLHTAEQQPSKKEKKRGRQPGHGSPPGVQETAHSSGTQPKEAGNSLLLEKLTREQGSGEGRERQRWLPDFDLVSEGLMQLLSSNSIPFLSA